jgi:hypothetical protein
VRSASTFTTILPLMWPFVNVSRACAASSNGSVFSTSTRYHAALDLGNELREYLAVRHRHDHLNRGGRRLRVLPRWRRPQCSWPCLRDALPWQACRSCLVEADEVQQRVDLSAGGLLKLRTEEDGPITSSPTEA